jgi:parallel beta-helix repeat protein
MKKTKVVFLVFLIMITLCVINAQPVRSQFFGTIYIRSDGSVEGTDRIQRDGDVYTFTADIYHSIVVERDSIVVDGWGYTLQGKGTGNGIDLSGRKNITVKNLEINQFDTGIYINVGYHVPRNNTISGNIVTNNNRGIHILGAYPTYFQNNNRIYGNNITNNNEFGILIAGSSNNRIYGNNIANNNGNGILISESVDNRIYRNNIANNGNGIYIDGGSNNSIYHNNFINNTADVPGSWVAFFGYESWVPPNANVWDYGKEGNYWSDYVTRYPNATEIDGSGIWDTTYVISENNQDNYPLMSPVVIPEFPDEENPTVPPNGTSPSHQPGFLGSSLPVEYGYAIVAAIVVAIVTVTGYLYYKRRK